MTVLVVLLAILYAAAAAPSRPIVVPDLPLAVSGPVVAAPVAVVTSQSHAQDELGQYSYSYSNPLSSKVESKTVDGITRGGYSYLDSHGLVQNVNYVSDDVNGFRVAASNLPVGRVTPQEDEPLVAHEKAKAVAALQEAAVRDAAEAAVAHNNEVAAAVAPVSPVPVPVGPAPVVYSTPAPPVYVSPPQPSPVPEVHVTPVPVTFISPAAPQSVGVSPALPFAPSPTPLIHVSPSSPPHISPTSYSVPVEPAHSYATVELDSSDFPAPVPTPGAYFRPAQAAIAVSPTPIPVSTPAPVVYEEIVPGPTPAPVVYEEIVPVPTPTPLVHAAPVPVVADHSPVVAAPVAVVTSQSHAQDELGQYSYSYSNPLSSKVESKTVDGITRGGYSYLDSHGLVQNVNYVSDDYNGFQVAASNLPTAAVPVDIPDSYDVAAAKAVFFAEIAKARGAADHAPH